MRHAAWMSTIAYYIGLLALVTMPLREGWVAWLPVILLIQVVGGLTISVGYHRLFCHQAFKAARPWHWLFAGLGLAFWYGSPSQWKVTHTAHHKHSDTALDPHPSGPRALLTKAYKDVPLSVWSLRRLWRTDPVLHQVVDAYYVGLALMLAAAIVWIWPTFFFMAYLPALGVAHLIGAIHNTVSHHGGAPHDIWWMELIAPAGGEWLHGTHHAFPGRRSFRTRWFHIDPGALLIRAIRT